MSEQSELCAFCVGLMDFGRFGCVCGGGNGHNERQHQNDHYMWLRIRCWHQILLFGCVCRGDVANKRLLVHVRRIVHCAARGLVISERQYQALISL